jgi:phosphohistidine swiveling domain-containing protein
MTLIVSNLGSTTEQKKASLYRLAELYRQIDGDDDAASAHLSSTDEWNDYFACFGDDSPTSLLYYLPTLRVSIVSVLFMIRLIAAAPARASVDVGWQSLKSEIEQRLESGYREDFSIFLRLYRRCLKRTEDDDAVLQRATAMVRYLLQSIAKLLVSMGYLETTDSIFHLSSSELERILHQASVEDSAPGELGRLLDTVARRAREFDKYSELSPPAMLANGKPMNPKSKANEDTYSGTAACAGIVSGTVVVVKDPFTLIGRRAVNNAIVVTPLLTPALAYGLTGALALITEAGGMASHGAIVAREMGIPTVIGLKGATTIFETGSIVEVNGSSGEVKVVS